jgi:chromosome segregation ATPase
MKSPL